MRPSWSATTLLAAALACAGCAADDVSPDAPVDLDAAGLPEHAIDSVPAVTIGRDPSSDDYVFRSVLAGGLVGDSLIVVADDLLDRIGVYDLQGRFLRWVVSPGEGPGEAQSLRAAGVLPDGTIWMYDVGNNHRLTTLHADGTVLSEARIRGMDRVQLFDAEIVGPASDGAWWLTVEEAVEPGRPGEAFRVPTEIWRLPREGPAEAVWTGLGEERVWGGSQIIGPDGEPGPEVGARSGGLLPALYLSPFGASVLMAWSDSSFVSRLDPDGRVTRVGSFEARRIPVPEREPPEGAPPGVRAAARRALLYPEILRIFVDPDRSVWLGQYAESADGTSRPAFYRIADGRPVAALQGPPLGRPQFIGRGWFLTSRLDRDMQEIYVALHRFDPEASAGR